MHCGWMQRSDDALQWRLQCTLHTALPAAGLGLAAQNLALSPKPAGQSVGVSRLVHSFIHSRRSLLAVTHGGSGMDELREYTRWHSTLLLNSITRRSLIPVARRSAALPSRRRFSSPLLPVVVVVSPSPPLQPHFRIRRHGSHRRTHRSQYGATACRTRAAASHSSVQRSQSTHRERFDQPCPRGSSAQQLNSLADCCSCPCLHLPVRLFSRNTFASSVAVRPCSFTASRRSCWAPSNFVWPPYWPSTNSTSASMSSCRRNDAHMS